MTKYITLQSSRNSSLVDLLNLPQYKDYEVITILQRGEDYIAFLEHFPPVVETKTKVELPTDEVIAKKIAIKKQSEKIIKEKTKK